MLFDIDGREQKRKRTPGTVNREETTSLQQRLIYKYIILLVFAIVHNIKSSNLSDLPQDLAEHEHIHMPSIRHRSPNISLNSALSRFSSNHLLNGLASGTSSNVLAIESRCLTASVFE